MTDAQPHLLTQTRTTQEPSAQALMAHTQTTATTHTHFAWSVSVHQFMAFTRDSGHLLSQGQWRNSAQEGISGQYSLQQQRPPHYQVEVRVSERFYTEAISVTLQGRIDGVLMGAIPLLEEIKTTVQATDTLLTRENHWLQLYCYAWLYLRRSPFEQCLIQLTYYNVEHKTERSFLCGTTRTLLEAHFQPKIKQYLDWIQQFWTHRKARNNDLKQRLFPFEYERPQQVEIMSIVRECLKSHDTLLLEASTGIGKTAAVTFPALKQLTGSLRSRLLCLSAKITTQANTQAFLALMSTPKHPLNVLQLTAQERICQCSSAGSLTACPSRLNYYQKIHSARQDAFAHHWLDSATIQAIAQKHAVCPYRLQFEILPWTDVIIADYNYVFDPRSNVMPLLEPDLRQTYVLIDECHNLVDRARDMYSMTLSFQALRHLLTVFFSAPDGLQQGIETIIQEAQRVQHSKEPLPSLALQRACDNTLRYLERELRHSSGLVDASILNTYFDLHFFHRLIALNAESIRVITEASPSEKAIPNAFLADAAPNEHVMLSCVDPSSFLENTWQRLGGTILYSGTLQPARYYQQLLGLTRGKSASFLRDFSEQVHAEILPLDLRYRQRHQQIPAILEAIKRMFTLKPGNHFVFFSSYQFMKQVHTQFKAQYPDVETRIQTHGMSLDERMRFLEDFKPKPTGNRVGFVVMGGVFGEGVDLPGDRLMGVMLVSIALPMPDARTQAIEEYFSQRDDSGYAYAYLYPSLCRTLQASGRLIRTDEDEGVLILADRRFAQPMFLEAFAAYQPKVPAADENDYDSPIPTYD